MLSALCERDSGSVEVTAAEALGQPGSVYRCLACGQAVFPSRGDGQVASFSHADDAAPCRRNPKRPDRRKTFRTGGRRTGD